MAIASVQAEFVSRGLGQSKFNRNVTTRGRMCPRIGSLCLPTGVMTVVVSIYIHTLIMLF